MACAKYTPAPVSPDGQLQQFNQRSLSSAGLRSWFDSLGVPQPEAAWTPRQLALAGTWFRTDRAVRAAEIRVADAAVVRAGGRPLPGVSTDLEYAFSDPQASSRWGIALAGIFTVELGGKRGARIGRAQAEAMAVRAAMVEREWTQANEVYAAALSLYGSYEIGSSAAIERGLLDTLVRLAQTRFESGSMTRLEVARIQTERDLASKAGRELLRDTKSHERQLALALGVPFDQVQAIDLANTNWYACREVVDRDSLLRTALATRWEVRRASAEYQVAEGDVRLEVASASPDLTIGPGLFFDQGTGKFTLGFGLPAIPFGGKKRAIHEAEARRELAGTRLMQTQETVLAEVDAADAACTDASIDTFVTMDLRREVEGRVKLAEAAYNRGELGKLELMTARLELVRSDQALLEATQRRREAGLELDRVSGAWGTRADGAWPRAPEGSSP